MTDDTPPSAAARFRAHAGLASRHLDNPHDLTIWLPPDYDADAGRRYPVLYMQDGQNLFDDDAAYASAWRLHEAAHGLIEAGRVEPLIIVGIHNAGAYRIDEYTPTRDAARQAGGNARRYGRMLVEEIKPLVDREYRTRPEAEHTGLGGSSLGGLVSLWLGLELPRVFGRLAVMSPSVWWDNRFIVRRTRALARRPATRIWLSIGLEEGPAVVDAARRVRDALLAKGWREGDDLHYAELEGAGHDEQAWGAQSAAMLEFLFPGTAATPREPAPARSTTVGASPAPGA